MTSKTTLVVLGATGNQGGSVLRTFSGSAQWHLRGVTRNVSSEESQKLISSGVEMVQGSLEDVESLISAFQGATAIFAATDFWATLKDQAAHTYAKDHNLDIAKYAQQVEENWGRNIIQAALQIPTLTHFIFSSLPPVRQLTQGKFTHVRHFDGKANISAAIREIALWPKTTQIFIGYYNSNIAPGSYFSPVWNATTKRFEISGAMHEDDLLPYIDTPNTTGPFVASILAEEPGSIVLAFDKMQSQKDACKVLEKVTGRQFAYVQRSIEEISNGPFGREAVESSAFHGQYGFFGEKVDGWREGLKWPHDLKQKPQTRNFEDWAREQDWSGLKEN